MNRIIVFICILLIYSCTAKTNTGSNTEIKDSLAVNTVWINDELGIVSELIVADTTVLQDDPLFAYGTKITLPLLLSKKGEYSSVNMLIRNDFDSIISTRKEIKEKNEDEYQLIWFNYFVKDSIITLKVMNQMAYHLGEGTTVYSIYHFDYKNNKILSTDNMFQIYGMSQVPVLNAIAEQITAPGEPSEPDFDAAWFETIKWKNINALKLYWNEKGQLFVIYRVKENGIEAEFMIN